MRTLPPPGSTVVIYARYSTKHQDQRSIEGQIALCRAYAERQGWVVVKVYFDAARSGTTTIGRTGFFDMLGAADREEFQVLLVEDIDRLSRNARDMHTVAQELEELDIALCTVSGGLVSDMEVAFKSVQNAQYVKQNAEKVRRGQELVVRNGRISGSKAYGYRKVHQLDAKGEPINGVREIDPVTGPVVIRIFKLYHAGVSTFAIAQTLNAEGVPSPKGKQWRAGVLSGGMGGGILRNRLYIGEFWWGRTKVRKRQGREQVKYTPQSDWLSNEHPELVLIERDVFDQVQERLAAQGEGPFHSKKKVEYLFSRKLICSECGSAYVMTNGRLACSGATQKGVCTRARRVDRASLETAVLKRLKDHILVPEILEPCLAEYRAEAQSALAEYAGKVERSQVRLKEIEGRIANLVTQLGASSGVTYLTQVLTQEIETLGAEKQRLEREVRQKPRDVGLALDAGAVVARLRDTLEDLQRALESEDLEAVRARDLLRGLVDRIVISPLGELTDGRGAGPVMITVEGRLGELLDLAHVALDRVTKHGSHLETVLDGSTLTFRFSFPLEPPHDPRRRQVYTALPAFSRLLDDAEAPVAPRAFLAALAELEGVEVAEGGKALRVRLETIFKYLREEGLARWVKVRSAGAMRGSALDRSGWVWNHIDRSDEAWCVQAMRPKPVGAVLPVIRLSAPQAMVVVIGPAQAPIGA